MKYRREKLTEKLREEALHHRQVAGRSWHSPHHFEYDGVRLFHLTAACYKHKPIIGTSVSRLAEFEQMLVDTLAIGSAGLVAWCVLPNHWHALARTDDVRDVCSRLGRLHGGCSFRWNGEDACRGRKVFHGVADRRIRGEAHMYATVNYIHHNPVRHGYATTWTEWPYSSAASYLDSVGKAHAEEMWRRYPVLDYGAGWDDAEM